MKQNRLILLILLELLLVNYLFANSQYYRLKAGIHFDSQVSGGKYSLEELALIIDKSSLDVAIITDHDNMEVRYGLPWFRKAFQFSVKRNSISNYGFQEYFNKINNLNNFFPKVEIIPGIEAVPYYHWEGNPIYSQLSLMNWHRHLLVFGMENIEDYQNLPSLKKGFGEANIQTALKKNIIYYTLLILLVLADIILIIRSVREKHTSVFSILFFIFAGYILIIEFPYYSNSITPYAAETSVEAFQKLTDYVIDRNGLVFWAHPESEYEQELSLPLLKQSILMKTEKYPQLVYNIQNATGFAGFWEGMDILGKPGGLWDRSLEDYCTGLRNLPQFIIGELDFEESNNLKLLNETNTFIFAENRSQKAIFDAMRKGRMYTTRNFLGEKLVIDEFKAHNLSDETSAFMGETLFTHNSPIAINIKISTLQNINDQTLTLYRNDIPIKQILIQQSTDQWIVDESYPKTGKFYYRLYGGENWINLVTNPIFVENR